MSLIRCDDDCLYQIDGYCNLETPTVITNHTGGCIHFIERPKGNRGNTQQKESKASTNPPERQTLL